MVIANATEIGNCLLLILKGNFLSEGVIDSLGIITVRPTFSPVITFALTMKSCISVIWSLVPFINPCVGLMFLSNITGFVIIFHKLYLIY
ncbi:hypothetical protein YC2023_110872 [Brassica napus]